MRFSQQYVVPERKGLATGTFAGSEIQTGCFCENWVCRGRNVFVFNMGVALGQITSPKHLAGILVIAVLAAPTWPNQEKFFNAVC